MMVYTVHTDLKSCSIRRDVQWGRILHAKAVESQKASDMYGVTTLINMYRMCNKMVEARGVFDSIQSPDVVAFNTLILGYAENAEEHITLHLFTRMSYFGLVPDSITFVAAIKACSLMALHGDACIKRECLKWGTEVHMMISCHMDNYLLNTLIDMYGKCGSMSQARAVFDSMQAPDVVSWTAVILGYAENGDGVSSLDLFSSMKAYGCVPNSITYAVALKACTCFAMDEGGKEICLERGRRIHTEIRCPLSQYLLNALIDMYAKCGSMKDAQDVFNKIQEPDVVSWTILIAGYVEIKKGYIALSLFQRMKEHGCVPNRVTYAVGLKACASLAVDGDECEKSSWLKCGRQIHSEIGCNLDQLLRNTLIDMYAKCDSMDDARAVFYSIERPDVVSWTAMLNGYVKHGQGDVALSMFSSMKEFGCVPSFVTYVAALKACTSLALQENASAKEESLKLGRDIHSEIPRPLNQYLLNTLVDMYSKCGSMGDAQDVFDSIQKPSVIAWTALLSGYVESDAGHVALDVFSKMKASGCVPNSFTYATVIKACGLIGALSLGRRIHLEITEFTPQIVTCLVDFYAKCGSMEEAHGVFLSHPKSRHLKIWTALLGGYSRFGDIKMAFYLFEAMQDDGLRPDGVTFVCLLLCCSHAGCVEKAREFFDAMTAQYGVSRTLVHYTCMVDALGRANRLNEAIGMIIKMPCTPDVVTWRTLCDACRKWKNVDIGREALEGLENANRKMPMCRWTVNEKAASN